MVEKSTDPEGLGTPGYQQAFATSADLNGDGIVNILDLVLTANQIGHPAANNAADINKDGVIDTKDLALVAKTPMVNYKTLCRHIKEPLSPVLGEVSVRERSVKIRPYLYYVQ